VQVDPRRSFAFLNYKASFQFHQVLNRWLAGMDISFAFLFNTPLSPHDFTTHAFRAVTLRATSDNRRRAADVRPSWAGGGGGGGRPRRGKNKGTGEMDCNVAWYQSTVGLYKFSLGFRV
jgi:hypothetical protein